MSADVLTTTTPLDERAADVLTSLLAKSKLTGEERMAVHIALTWKPAQRLPENVPWPRELRGEAI